MFSSRQNPRPYTGLAGKPARSSLRCKEIADPTCQTPERIYLTQERVDDIHYALNLIAEKGKWHLRYRFGFDDDTEHPLTETVKRFYLSESGAQFFLLVLAI